MPISLFKTITRNRLWKKDGKSTELLEINGLHLLIYSAKPLNIVIKG